MFCDEIMLLELRLKILDKFVNKFIITESKYLHNGESKKLNFDINKFKDFKNKIEYIVVNEQPPNILFSKISDTDKILNEKKIFNSLLRENYQRENLSKGLYGADKDDFIIIGDLDEIPNLNNINFKDLDNEILIFKQKMFYYKFNLCYENFLWFGSKCIKKKNLVSPQWLRNIKNKNYPKWRIDALFSKKKYNNIKFIEDGGWHFSYLKDPINVEKKLKSIRHHIEYDLNPLGVNKIGEMIKNKKLIYNYNTDQRTENKFENNETLNILETKKLPKYIQNNLSLYNKWLET